ncbi:receptor-type tyrosine-protein phosphatase epsilon-like [Argopecten irradians]|uniref:receptor-type tyrosine-protein phosphatase epsilon-like n=1 Tax=Argopecten irradians TaxID=31199 RepID=UPI00371DDC52
MADGHCNECKPGFYGDLCNQICPDNCKDKICSMNDGNCTECVSGYYGRSCRQMCPPNCKNNVCNLQDGQCIEKKAITSEPENQAGTYAGAAVGALIVIAVIVVVVVFVIRRRRQIPNRKMNNNFDGDLETTLSLPPVKSKSANKSRAVSAPVEVNKGNEYINVGDLKKEEVEQVVYCNMERPDGVSIEEIRAMIPQKMKNEEEEFKKEFKLLPWGAVYPHLEGSKPQNKAKNRFKTTFPYDHSRVILDTIGKDPNSDYINANYIDGIDDKKAYVASQGPRENTVDDFWRMVWQLNTGIIVMVTNLVEGGKVKCHQYWPEEGESPGTKHFNIRLDRERTYAFYVLREISLRLKKTKEERQIHHFHFTSWPDHGTPNNLELVLFHRHVTSFRTNLPGPMIVHCSAGLGRTGTFIGLDVLSKEEKKTGRVDISQYIRTMRKDRMNMVQTHEQYIALHELLIEAADLADTLIPSSQFPDTLSKMLPAGKPTNQTKLRKEFEKLLSIVPKYSSDNYTAGKMKENKDKNRTMSNIAVDTFRAYLRSQKTGRTDYINAVTLQSHRSKSGYLLTQFPLADTVDDFWAMVTDYSCENIVVLGTPTEHWLRDESEIKNDQEIYVEKLNTFDMISGVDIGDFLFKTKISSGDTVRIFTIKDWTSESFLPPSDSSLLQLLEQLDSRRRSDTNKPVVVMCRNGCTQSGLFCCLSNIRDQMKMDEEVDIFQTARQIQIRCPQALRNIEQYQYSYKFIGQYLDSTNVYIN